MFYSVFYFSIFSSSIYAFQTIINGKYKLPLLNFLDMDIPTMTITLSQDTDSVATPKLCKDCVYFEPTIFKQEYDLGRHEAKCTKFQELDMVNGYLENVNVVESRKSRKYCGKEGKYFKKKKRPVMRYNYDDEDEERKKILS
tara:strand:- start:9812 stop:10237 length:426 start_codon:yes stop_codon:yes gene_type:complete